MIEVKSEMGIDFYKTLVWRVEVVSHQHFEGNYLSLSVSLHHSWLGEGAPVSHSSCKRPLGGMRFSS